MAVMFKTHCPHGHEYTKENSIPRTRKGKEVIECRACNNARVAKWRAENIALNRRLKKKDNDNYYSANKAKILAQQKEYRANKQSQQQ